jgi:hypothetical protein
LETIQAKEAVMIAYATTSPAIGDPGIIVMAFRHDGSLYYKVCIYRLPGDLDMADAILQEHEFNRVSPWRFEDGQWAAEVETAYQ